jgi:hypothetical protein
MEDPDYKERLLRNKRTRQVLSSIFAEHNLDALVYPLQKRLTVPIANSIKPTGTVFLRQLPGFRPSPCQLRLIELAHSFERRAHVRRAAEQCAGAARAMIALPCRGLINTIHASCWPRAFHRKDRCGGRRAFSLHRRTPSQLQTLGYMSFQSCPRSYASAARIRVISSKGRLASCSPMGSPARSNPQGRDIAGSPAKFQG